MAAVTGPETFELTLAQAEIVLLHLDSGVYDPHPALDLELDLRVWIKRQKDAERLRLEAQ